MLTTLLRAQELARTGRYASWAFVQDQLLAEGLADARQALMAIRSREDLDRLCRTARASASALGES